MILLSLQSCVAPTEKCRGQLTPKQSPGQCVGNKSKTLPTSRNRDWTSTRNDLALLFAAALRLSQTWVTQFTLLVHPMFEDIQCVPKKDGLSNVRYLIYTWTPGYRHLKLRVNEKLIWTTHPVEDSRKYQQSWEIYREPGPLQTCLSCALVADTRWQVSGVGKLVCMWSNMLFPLAPAQMPNKRFCDWPASSYRERAHALRRAN